MRNMKNNANTKMERLLLFFNIIWSVIAVCINYAITFFMTSYVTNTVGVEAYGFVTLANTFTSYLDVISIALNAFACRYIAIAFHKGKQKEANTFFNSVIIADILLSLVILLICCPVILKIENLLNVSENLVFDVKILFLLVLARYMVTIVGTAFTVGTFIANRISLSEKQKSVSYIIQGTLLIVLFAILPAKIWYVGLATYVAALFLFAKNVYYTKKFAPELRINANYFDFKAVKKLLSCGIWNSINNLGNILNSGLDLVITNLMLSPGLMGEIAIGKSIGTMCNSLLEAFTNSFRPRILQLYAEDNQELLINELKNAMRVTGSVANIIFAGFIACGSCFLKLWLPTQDTDFLFLLSMIVLASDIIIGVVKPLYYVFTLTKKLKIPCYITIATGILNVLAMYLLIKYTSLDAYAVVLTTLILNYIHFIDTPLYAAYCLKCKLTVFYPTIIRHFLSCAVLVTVLFAVGKLLPIPYTWPFFFAKCGFLGILGVMVSVVTVYSKKEIKTFVKSFGDRFRGHGHRY